jgi:hypothetical protein
MGCTTEHLNFVWNIPPMLFFKARLQLGSWSLVSHCTDILERCGVWISAGAPSILTLFTVFSSPLARVEPWLAHNSFFPDPLQFITHKTSHNWHCEIQQWHTQSTKNYMAVGHVFLWIHKFSLAVIILPMLHTYILTAAGKTGPRETTVPKKRISPHPSTTCIIFLTNLLFSNQQSEILLQNKIWV